MANDWSNREQMILDAVVRISDSRDPSSEEIVEATGLTDRAVQSGLRNLFDADYLTGDDVSSNNLGYQLQGIRLLEKGLRSTGIWPADPYDEFVRIVQAAIMKQANPVERGKLERLLESLSSVGQGVATGLLIEAAKRTLGMT